MAADDVDYVTVIACTTPHRVCAALVRYQPITDDYAVVKASVPLPRPSATRVAKAWAASLHLEFRP